jgi:hypothetical protein
MSSLQFNSIFGFRSDDKGIHTSRTLILAELSWLINLERAAPYLLNCA